MADFGGNMALNIEQRLGQKLTNEQYLMWFYLFNRWPNLTIQPLFFQGTWAAPYTIYNANILYIAYSLHCDSNGTLTAAPSGLALYNELNAVVLSGVNNSAVWDATAAAMRYSVNHIEFKNIYFSRIVIGAYLFGSIIGYQINI